jgi:hypothetical protein
MKSKEMGHKVMTLDAAYAVAATWEAKVLVGAHFIGSILLTGMRDEVQPRYDSVTCTCVITLLRPVLRLATIVYAET